MVARSEERVHKADQHLEIVKAFHGKAAAALRAAQEAWQRLEELQDCVSECFLVFSSFSDLFSVGDNALC